MTSYRPPTGSLFFNFTDSGYTPPDFLNINFTYISEKTSDLQAAITVSQLYNDSTHTYVKSCRKIVVGYSNAGVQTITLPCLFGGIRDLASYIQVSGDIYSGSLDLNIDIFAKAFYTFDLEANIFSKPFYTFDLSSIIKPQKRSSFSLESILNIIELRDLPTSIRAQRQSLYDLIASVAPQKRDYYDLTSALNIIELRNLPASIRARIKALFDLQANVAPAYPYDLNAILNVIELRDLPTSIRVQKLGLFNLLAGIRPQKQALYDLIAGIRVQKKGSYDLLTYTSITQPVDLLSFLNIIELRDLQSSIIGILFKGTSDLTAGFGRITFKNRSNLLANVRGWSINDLPSFIGSVHTDDLETHIFGFYRVFKNLPSYVVSIPPANLRVDLHGYDLANLNAFTIVGYQPNDLPANITTVKPKELIAYIYGLAASSVSVDLQATIHGFFIRDLTTYIGAISAANLYADINAVGKYLDLIAYIVPKTINIKKILSISLYEHYDLKASINYNCLKSSFSDLSVSLYPINRLDLKAYIIGWFGDKADNLLDLRAFINFSDYQETNYINIHADIYEKNALFTNHPIKIKDQTKFYKVTDTHSINLLNSSHILSAYITGILESRDLLGYITALPIANFTTLPSWVNPQTYEVLINLNRFEERWYRFVEMMFFTNSENEYHFFYVPEEDKVYKLDRNRTWKIQLLGFSEDTENIYFRNKTIKKFLFKLDNYATFDEALSDLIDRVSVNKYTDLTAYLQTYTYPSSDLSTTINVKKIRSWSLSCKAVVKCNQRSHTVLFSQITPELNHGLNNLTASIVGKAYEPPADPTNIKFIFDDDTFVAPGSYNNMNWTYKQAEDFWKE